MKDELEKNIFEKLLKDACKIIESARKYAFSMDC
jgi:hypothetical protein